MEEKESSGVNNLFWSVLGCRGSFKFLLRRFSNKSSYVKNLLISNQSGFTLLELIIVIGILSIFSIGAIAILNPVAQFQKANDARRKSDLSQIQKSLEGYYQDNGKYPSDYSTSDYRIKGLDGNVVNWGTSWQPYMDLLPKDPSSSKKYVYYVASDGQAYFIYASLDMMSDPQSCNRGAVCLSLSSNSIPDKACGGTCNFGVSSPNVSP